MKKLAIFIAALLLFSAAVFAQGKPKIAVYVTDGGDKSVASKMLATLGAHKIVGDGLAKAIGAIGKSDAVNLTGDIAKGYGEAAGEAQAADIGRQFGVQYLCIVAISNVKGKTFALGVRLINTANSRTIANAGAPVDLSNGPGMLTALANIAKELVTGMASSAVQSVAQGAMGGAAPTPAYQQSMPVQQAAQGQPVQYASTVQPVQDAKPLAVYMACEEPKNAAGAHMVLGGELAKAIKMSGKYKAVNLTDNLLKLLSEEHGDMRSGAIDETKIRAVGKQLDVRYLCIVEINEVKGNSFYLNARLVDAVTARTINTATAASGLSNSREMADAAQEIAAELVGGAAETVAAPQVQQTMPVQAMPAYPAQETKPITQEVKRAEFRDDIFDMDMVFVSGGTITTLAGGRNVTLKSFYLGKYEISQKQWVRVMGHNSSKKKGDNLPVGDGSAYYAKEFVSRLNSITGKKYRLPTEAELEYAMVYGGKNGVSTRSPSPQDLGFRVALDSESGPKKTSVGTGGFGSGYSAGWYMFFDATYFEAYFGVLGGGVTTGAFAKLPFGSEAVKFFPLAGFDYNGGVENAFGILGAGIDVNLYQDVYVRSEFMYSLGKFNFSTFRGGAGYRF